MVLRQALLSGSNEALPFCLQTRRFLLLFKDNRFLVQTSKFSLVWAWKAQQLQTSEVIMLSGKEPFGLSRFWNCSLSCFKPFDLQFLPRAAVSQTSGSLWVVASLFWVSKSAFLHLADPLVPEQNPLVFRWYWVEVLSQPTSREVNPPAKSQPIKTKTQWARRNIAYRPNIHMMQNFLHTLRQNAVFHGSSKHFEAQNAMCTPFGRTCPSELLEAKPQGHSASNPMSE